MNSTLGRTLVIYQGGDYLFDIVVRDDDGNPLDLTDTTLTFQARQILDSEAVLELTTGTGIEHADQSGEDVGHASLAIEGDDTVGLQGIHWYGLWLTDGLGNRQPLREGGTLHVKVPVVREAAS